MGKQYVLETNQPCVLPPWIGPRWPLPRSGVQGHSFVSPSRVTGGWTPGGGHLGAEAGLGGATAQPQAGRPGRPRAGPRRPCLQRRTPFPFLALFPSPVVARTRTHVFVTVCRRSAHLQGLRPSRRSARGPQETGRPRGALRDLTAFCLVLMAEASLQMKVLSARTLTSPPLKR